MFSDRFPLRRLALPLVASAGALVLLAACGGNHTMAGHEGMTETTSSASAPAASSQPSPAFNDADVTFAQMMIPHHKQAIEMADLAGTRASDPEIKNLAVKIKAAQDPEIVTLTGYLTSWGASATPAAGMDGMAGHDMSGTMTDDDMTKLMAAKGADFDKMFAQMMIVHHNGAIEMARTEQAQGIHAEAKALAMTIETGQKAEVTQMQKILDRL